MQVLSQETILFFDTKCILCNSSVTFILKHEKDKKIIFCSQQSVLGKQKIKELFKNKTIPNSLVFLNQGKVYSKSTAVLHLCKFLKGLFPILFCFIIVPPFIRNLIYDIVAKNRYKWFGKQNQCILANESNKDRFIL
jgi:predicted DCC family thiol-disulfide oxidoreductase YuxK